MPSRRKFIQSLMGAMGTAMLSPIFPRSAFATQGSAAASGTWAGVTDPGIWNQAWTNKFSKILPNALDPKLLGIGFIYRPDPGTTNTYTISAGQIEWDVLGIPGKLTKVWGYGNYEGVAAGLPVTFPGRTFVVQRNAPINVNWVNNLTDAAGAPLPHLLPVDQTISMPIAPDTVPINGVPIAVHHHGGDTAVEFDGGPDQWQTPARVQIGPGVMANNLNTAGALFYSYLNTQEASTHWYHDHAEGLTRTNAYAGLAGLYVIRDANEATLIRDNKIPAGPYEVALVIQDRAFAADGSLAYSADPVDYPTGPLQTLPDAGGPTHMPEMFGDIITVNGVAWPNLDVEPREYRLRLLNGSDSRVYALNFGALKVWQISTDLGFLNSPVPMNLITIAPGERMDVVVDFAPLALMPLGSQSVVVTNSAGAPYPFGVAPAPGSGPDTIMQFSALKGLDPAFPITKTNGNLALRGNATDTMAFPPGIAKAPKGATVRRVLLAEGVDEYGRILPLMGTYDQAGVKNIGTLSFQEPPTETPALGATEVWEFWNISPDAHPIHMHLVQFQVLNRQRFSGTVGQTTMPNGWTGQRLSNAALRGRAVEAPENERGWKDTVLCPPNQVTRILVTFNRPGKYVYHCHILSHEEHDMMRWYQVI